MNHICPNNFQWTEECVTAFEDLKQYLSNPPILSQPDKEVVLYAYLAVTKHVVSFVLVRNQDGIQRPVYYVSKSLQEVKTRYLPLEKAVLSIVHATRKLPYYFQTHTIVVLTQLPLQALLRKSDYIGRIAKWGTKLGAYDVKYKPQTAIKGQVLADFIAEFTEGVPEEESAITGVLVSSAMVAPSWKVYIDEASN